MRNAATLWASVRQEGQPTADPQALDGDVILSAQALSMGYSPNELVAATTNVGHLSRLVTAAPPRPRGAMCTEGARSRRRALFSGNRAPTAPRPCGAMCTEAARRRRRALFRETAFRPLRGSSVRCALRGRGAPDVRSGERIGRPKRCEASMRCALRGRGTPGVRFERRNGSPRRREASVRCALRGRGPSEGRFQSADASPRSPSFAFLPARVARRRLTCLWRSPGSCRDGCSSSASSGSPASRR